MRRLFVCIVLLCLSISACRCNVNDTTINDWKDTVWKEIDAGIFKCYNLTYNNDSLYGAPQNIYYIVLPKKYVPLLSFAYTPTLTPTSVQAKGYDALAAVNGSFFDMKYGNPVCYLKINDTVRGINVPAEAKKKYNRRKRKYVVVEEAVTIHRKFYQYASIVLDKGKISIVEPSSSRHFEDSLPQSNIMTAGPMLIKNGVLSPQRTDRTFVSYRHNRTALGLRSDGSVVLLVADGRSRSNAEGLSLPDLANLMKSLGCVDAINLDGGGSTSMYIDPSVNKDCIPPSGVLNYPSDNNAYDHDGERRVSSIVVINKPNYKSK